ncbi:hypothetical protein ACHAXS_005722 [Conticribra weissflogii]
MRISTPNAFLWCYALVITWVVYNNNLPSQFSAKNDCFDVQSKEEPQPQQQKHGFVSQSRLHRLARYKDRYNYTPPATHIADITHRQAFCGAGPNFETYFERSKDSRSDNNEDKHLYNLFVKDGYNKIDDGLHHGRHTIVELGAFDGITESNSRFFEECLGWDALLIEGMPVSFQRLVKNRPQAHRMHFAPTCSAEEDARNATVKFDNYVWPNAGLESVVTAFTNKTERKPVDVPCGSLTEVLLDIFPHGHVTIFSLDVEGSEPLVLRNIDFTRVFIEIMIIEHFNAFCSKSGHCQSRKEFRKIMDENGYIRFTRGVTKSDLYIHPSSTHYLNMALGISSLNNEYQRFEMNKYGENEVPNHALW